MSDIPNLSGKVGLDVTDFKAGIAQLNREIRVVESGFRATAAGLGDWAKSAGGLETRIGALNKEIDLQKSKISNLKSEYQKIVTEKGATSKAAQDLQIKLNKETETLNKMQTELKDSNASLSSMGKEEKKTTSETQSLDKAEEKAKGSTKNFGDAMKTLTGHLKDVASGIANVVANIAKLAAGVVTGALAAITGLAIGIGAVVLKSGEWADQFATLSSQTGISTTKLQELDYVGKKLDVDLSTISGSYSKMIRNMATASTEFDKYNKGVATATANGKKYDGTLGTAAAAFKELGISVTDQNGHLRDSQTVFDETITALGKIPDETERDALAMQIFGKSAMELNPLINAGADTIANLTDEAHKVGAVMSTEDVEALDKFKDSFDALHNTAKSIIGTIAAKLAPAFSIVIAKINEFLASAQGKAIIDKLAGAFQIMGDAITIIANALGTNDPLHTMGANLAGLGAGNGISILTRIGRALQGLQETFTKLQDAFKKGGIGGLLKAIIPEGGVGGIIEGLSGTIGKMIASLLTSFATKPAQLLQIGLNIIQGIGDSLVTAIPALIPTFLTLITSMVTFITQMLPTLITTGLSVILQLALGIMQAIPKLIPVVLQVITSFVQFLTTNLPILITAAITMLVALATGITQALPTLIPAVIAIIPAVVTTLLENLPLLITAALNLILALAQGLIAALPILIPEIPKIVQTIVDIIVNNFPLVIGMALTLITTIATALVDNLPLIAQATVDIVTELLNGIVAMLPEIITAAGQIITTIIQALADLLPSILQAGKDIVTGIWQGIQDAWAQLLIDMGGIIAGLPEWVKKLLGIASPSKVFAGIGRNMALGLGEGFARSYDTIRNQIGKAIGNLTDAASVNFGGSSFGIMQPATATAPISVTVNAAVSNEMDIRRMARMISLEIQRGQR